MANFIQKRLLFYDCFQVILGYAMIIAGVLFITFPLYKILGVMIFMHVVWGVHSVMYDAGKYH